MTGGRVENQQKRQERRKNLSEGSKKLSDGVLHHNMEKSCSGMKWCCREKSFTYRNDMIE